MTEALDLVLNFCNAWGTSDVDELAAYFAEDAGYHNVPIDPVAGPEQIRATIAGFSAGVERIEFEVRHAAASEGAVMTERVDRFFSPGGKVVGLPVMGTFEVVDGRITAWRDYFDLNQFMSQLGS